jgi:hypothetical protein
MIKTDSYTLRSRMGGLGVIHSVADFLAIIWQTIERQEEIIHREASRMSADLVRITAELENNLRINTVPNSNALAQALACRQTEIDRLVMACTLIEDLDLRHTVKHTLMAEIFGDK